MNSGVDEVAQRRMARLWTRYDRVDIEVAQSSAATDAADDASVTTNNSSDHSGISNNGVCNKDFLPPPIYNESYLGDILEVKTKCKDWMCSFRDLDPRHQILTFFNGKCI